VVAADVMVQRELVVAGDEQVRPTIAVIIRDRAAVVVEQRAIQADLCSNLAKTPAAQVLVQPVWAATDVLALKKTAPAHKYVQQPVAVVIEKGQAAAQGLKNGVMIGLFAVTGLEIHP